jgi:inner membrane protein
MNPAKVKINGYLQSVLAILAVLFLSLIPRCSIDRLIGERSVYYNSAVSSITGNWTGEQTIGDVFFIVPIFDVAGYEEDKKGNRIQITKEASETLMPSTRTINMTTTHEYRQRGIFRVPLISADMKAEIEFDIKKWNNYLKDTSKSIIHNKPLKLHLVIDYPDSISHNEFVIDGQKLEIRKEEKSLSAIIENPKQFFAKDKILLKVHLKFKLHNKLTFKTPGGENKISVVSDWASPGFFGSIPQENKVTKDGFTANWSLFEPSEKQTSEILFLEPVNIYSINTRAVKYMSLIVLLSLTLFFLFQILGALHLHFMHYLLLSLPLSIYFILLLALSEHVPFFLSYMMSATSVISLCTVYLLGIGASKRLATIYTVFSASTYAVIYVLLSSEDYALLFGAISLFVLLTAFMWLTRKIDWYKLGSEVTKGSSGT